MRWWLKQLRIDRGLSQRAVAEKSKISQQYYNYIENDERNPHVITAKKIADTLGFYWGMFYVDENKANN